MAILSRESKDSYMELINQLLLVAIRSDKHLEEAESMIDELSARKLDKGEQEYLNVLGDLVSDYEDEHHPIEASTPADMLKHLLESYALTKGDLAAKIGVAPSQISNVLAGRPFSTTMVEKLADRFGLDIALLVACNRQLKEKKVMQ